MLILLILVNTAVYYLFYNISADNEVEHLVEQTNTISETLSANPSIPSDKLLQAFLPANGMIRVYSEDGNQVISALMKKEEYRDLEGSFSTTETREIITGEHSEKIAVISKPIIWDDGEIVTLQVSDHLITLEKTMKTLFYVLLIASAFMLIPTFIAGNILSTFLLKPIKKLIETMKENTKEASWRKINLDNRSHDEIYEMEKTFNEMIDYLRDTFEKQAVFVSDASHELKTPVSIVKSYAQLLKRRGRDHQEVFDEAVDTLDSEADRMQKLIEQMLLLARNEHEVDKEIVDLGNLCDEVVQTFSKAYGRDIHFYGNDSLFVEGNKDQLQQVIYILIDNALKYSEAEVNVRVQKMGQVAEVNVTDYGDGIRKDDLPYLFDRFYRVDESRNRNTGGSGLGLAIAKVITELHAGDITVESKEGEGTTFILTMPIINKS